MHCQIFNLSDVYSYTRVPALRTCICTIAVPYARVNVVLVTVSVTTTFQLLLVTVNETFCQLLSAADLSMFGRTGAPTKRGPTRGATNFLQHGNMPEIMGDIGGNE